MSRTIADVHHVQSIKETRDISIKNPFNYYKEKNRVKLGRSRNIEIKRERMTQISTEEEEQASADRAYYLTISGNSRTNSHHKHHIMSKCSPDSHSDISIQSESDEGGNAEFDIEDGGEGRGGNAGTMNNIHIVESESSMQSSLEEKVLNTIDFRKIILNRLCKQNSQEQPFQKTLVLDLEGTLIHLLPQHSPITEGTQLTSSGQKIILRPGLQMFLETLSNIFEIVIYTSELEVWAKELLRIIDPNSSLVHHLLTQDHCSLQFVGHEYIYKRIIQPHGKRKKENVFIVNCNWTVWGDYLPNFVEVSKFVGDLNDTELRRILMFLLKYKNVKDVTQMNLGSKYIYTPSD